ncbi:hypothetical protein ABEB36_005421 [Hypothenemus hampei]|uniref:Protein YIPF3 n=1 Tax=Hypothenemus hampei TaxID=57062 RepID=A0ABD1EY61_HYPHA
MSSVIFIGSPDKSSKKTSAQLKDFYQLFLVSPSDICFRIGTSFVPPLTSKYRKVYVDLMGPLLGLFSLTLLLIYGYSLKKYKINVTPLESMICFVTCMPIFCFFLAKLGKSSIHFYEVLSLIGYSLFGHLFTLLVSFIFFHENSNTFFFISLIIFGGLSSFRLIVIFLKTIPIPGARLLVCSTISLINILFIIYLHFGYMHTTFS